MAADMKLRTRKQKRAWAKRLREAKYTLSSPVHASEYAIAPSRTELALKAALDEHFPGRYLFQARIGIYIADFLFRERNLVVEVDGVSHSTIKGRWHDKRRGDYLELSGYKTLRFNNSEVTQDVNRVIRQIEFSLR